MSNIYLNPKIDYAFKVIFGNQSQTKPLIGLLNAILYQGNPIIQRVEILNPYLPGQVNSVKDTYVDIHAELDDQSIVIIEMQVALHPDFFGRVLYNTAKKFSSQLITGELYGRLRSVITLVIGNFVFNDDPTRLLNHFLLYEKNNQLDYPAAEKFQIVVLELKKFETALNQVDSQLEMWLYFLRHADKLLEVPDKMNTVEEIVAAFEAAKKANLSPMELDELEKREKYALEKLTWRERFREAAMEEGWLGGREEGLAKGREIGLAEGQAQGREIGLAKGREIGLAKGREIGLAEGKKTILRQNIVQILVGRFGEVPAEILAEIKVIDQIDRLEAHFQTALTIDSLDQFKQRLFDAS